MYADDTLTPREAIRLCALGTLAAEPRRYGELARAIRHFISRVTGPSLEIMATSLELLRYEGLIDAIDGIGMEDDALLAITDAGRQELHDLLTAGIRTGATELNKLIVALKFRFLYLLERADQHDQIMQLMEASDGELARLEDLRRSHANDGGHLVSWLDHDIGLLAARVRWLEEFRKAL